MTTPKSQPLVRSQIFQPVCWILIILGIFLRFVQISRHDFIFYDEGMYLGHNRELLEKIVQFPAKNPQEMVSIIKILFNSALTTPKWLWFFISNLRVFFGGPEALHFTRLVSAFCGSAAVFMTYLFARRYFKSHQVALLSAAILAVLPSHVFYSRLAMQESLCTLCFLGGMYLYFSGREFGVKTFLSAIVLSGVFFTNYRMIILPVLLAVAEGMSALLQKRSINWMKLGGAILTFAAVIAWVWSLNNGSSRLITLAWMSRQAELAPQQWHWMNLFSYPYYIFSLEGILFGAAFFLNLYWVKQKDWGKLLPFALVVVQILIFSLASEKGARYLCVVLPFAAIAAGASVHELVLRPNAHAAPRLATVVFIVTLGLTLAQKSWALTHIGSGYRNAVEFIQSRDPQAKFISTQPLVVGLLAGDGRVAAAPKTARDMIILFAQGYRYLMVDPQAYVSWTEGDVKFTPKLVDYLGFIHDNMKPIYVSDHLNHDGLERFVLDHNENLMNSIRFLSRTETDFGAVYVYDIQECLQTMQHVAQSAK